MINLLESKKKMSIETEDALLLFAKAIWAAGEFQYYLKYLK